MARVVLPSCHSLSLSLLRRPALVPSSSHGRLPRERHLSLCCTSSEFTPHCSVVPHARTLNYYPRSACRPLQHTSLAIHFVHVSSIRVSVISLRSMPFHHADTNSSLLSRFQSSSPLFGAVHSAFVVSGSQESLDQ